MDNDFVVADTVIDRRKAPRPFNDGFILLPLIPQGEDLIAKAARIRSRLMAQGKL